ncbi:MAG TPA: response regulator, partial [Bacteroidales bacterium]|nr:response regulator [Bacteroidales bacterium]
MDVKITTKRIMVVEDDEFSYLLLKTILEKENLEVIRAVNGEEAMEIFSNDPTIDLILMDLKLPGIGGLEV